MKSKYSVSGGADGYESFKYLVMKTYNYLPNLFVSEHSTSKRYVFVCGCGHSGTTLIASRLGNHEDVFLIGRETQGFHPFLNLLSSKKIVGEWEYFASRSNKNIILEKTPKHVHSIKSIKKILPEAKIIQVVRNPLDNIASLYERFGNLDFCINRWVSDNEKILYNCGKFSNIIVVKYEELTSDPESHFKRIINFMDIEWSELVCTVTDSSYSDVMQSSDIYIKRVNQVSQPIQSKVDSWKNILTTKQAELVKSKTSRLAHKLGYSY